jgi:hypothetical protein
MENNKKPLKLALHGMDSRSTKIMMLFLQGPCKGVAHIVINADDADIDVFDGDAADSKMLLEKYVQADNQKPVIILSLWDVAEKGILYLRKPVGTDDMLRVLELAKKSIAKANKVAAQIDLPAVLQKISEKAEHPIAEPEKPGLKTYVAGQQEPFNEAKHQLKKGVDENDSDDYIGDIEDINVNDPRQFIAAAYDPDNFFQGTVQAASADCKEANKILLLKTDWKPVTFFPRTKELWIDASDHELKTFAGLKLKRKTMSAHTQLVPVDPGSISSGGTLYKFQNMEAFLWKLACWTSKGRYPQDIDYRKPVYLKNWPNFTRLLITPHALRIAALLIKGPRTMGNIAETLAIKPQYVFVFVSATYAVGLSGQARRASDMLVQALGLQRNKGKGLMSRILRKLRVN